MMKQILPLFLAMTLSFLGCAGYHFRTHNNPLKMYGIRSVYVPLFNNRSSLPDVSSAFTREIIHMLASYPDLEITTSYDHPVDAVLLGIIDSDISYFKTVTPSGEVEIAPITNTKDHYRPNMKIPQQNTIHLKLELVLIKNPTHQDVQLLQKNDGLLLYKDPRVVFRHLLPITDSFTRVRNPRRDGANFDENPDVIGTVNGTQNLGLFNNTIKKMAEDTAFQFKEMILHAF